MARKAASASGPVASRAALSRGAARRDLARAESATTATGGCRRAGSRSSQAVTRSVAATIAAEQRVYLDVMGGIAQG
jgi:hypothetical protein